MTDVGPRRRDVLVAVSGTSLLLAGCTESDSSVTTDYGAAYGREYGAGSE
ncbi:hypothetical protein [Natrinema salsiterrestre]|uniref:Uncharacterized protein n=1 Tax=Natrinema salsiterrestre TaxID=2950540 RepID=A0A9Q4L0D7_9EURY|nr:hypothetical protein [Natrinema salsiterrestre]MDF9745209.1 hypothetical protein [Natrinema salsiterrestre]